MPRNWKEVYKYHLDGCNEKQKGKRPDCFLFQEKVPLEGIRSRAWPNSVFAICGENCRKHLYWYNWDNNGCFGEIPSQELVQIFEKQSGRITELDEYMAAEEIVDEEAAELVRLLRKCEELVKRAGLI